MKRTLKILSATLALLLLFSTALLFSSCGKEEEAAETTGTTVSTDDSLPPLEIKNLEGMEIKILWPEMTSDGHYRHNEIAVTDMADVVDTAVMTRNTAVEAAYNVKITTETAFITDVARTVRTEYKGGTSTYHAIACAINNKEMVGLEQEGGLTDFNTLKYYDESQPWWNHELMEDFSLAGSRYFASGDIIYSDDFYPYCVFVNTQVSADKQIQEDYYELVMSKKWTLDKFHQIAVQANDLTADGNGDVWSELDMNGAVLNENFARAAYYAAGEGMVAFSEEGLPVWQMTPDRTQEILEKVISVVKKDNACYNTGVVKEHVALELKLFNTNKALFLSEELICSERITKSDNAANFQILPFPLYDEDSEYISILNDSLVLGIPVMCENKDDICLVLSAMSRESVNTLTPAFFETVLTLQYMQDRKSVEMLEIILDSVVPQDIATNQDWGGFMAQFKKLAFEGSTDFSSYHRSNIKVAMDSLNKYADLVIQKQSS